MINSNPKPRNSYELYLVDLLVSSLKILLIIFSFLASKIRYEITEGNHRGAFAVKNETGAIYVAGPLDYETRKEVNIVFFSLFLRDHFQRFYNFMILLSLLIFYLDHFCFS